MSQELRYTDRGDVLRAVQDQASRVYLQTIAANEREDRLLHKKLNAIDMEHRAQYLKMKKWIHDAQALKDKKTRVLDTHFATDIEAKCQPKTQLSTQRSLSFFSKPEGGKAHARRTLSQFNNDASKTSESRSKLSLIRQKTDISMLNKKSEIGNKNVKLQSIAYLDNEQPFPNIDKRRASSLLLDRVKYTDSEVARLKTSFAGKNTPPKRFRKFLPHLEASAIISEEKIHVPKQRNKGKHRRNANKAKRLEAINSVDSMTEKLPQISISLRKASTNSIANRESSFVPK